MVLSLYRRSLGKTNVPIAVLSEYTEKEYEPFDPYSRFYPAMPVSVCFSDTALYTRSKMSGFFILIILFTHILQLRKQRLHQPLGYYACP